MASNIVFLEQWKDELMNDEFCPLSDEEMAYVLYAAAMYSWTGQKTNFKDTFNRADLNRVMAPYYAQIDNILKYREGMRQNIKSRQTLDKEAIKDLASRGFTQKQICAELGYDEDKYKSISSNPGWKEGRRLFETAMGTVSIQKVQNKVTESTESLTEKVQNVTESTEKYSSVNSVGVTETFNF